ncbi:OmpA family protein [Calditerrivibrio sp.]|uniref:OmpA family protein n=1 Tax=Calditerrivibrio sp. TaxID=2792612 RepID=UPI003D0C463A
MKRAIFLAMFLLTVSPLFANDYKYSISPYLGYHYFGDDRDKKDRPELGLKVERFLKENLGFEVGLGYVPTEREKNGKDVDLFNYQTHLKYYIGNYSGFEPYLSGGLSGDITYGLNIGPSFALGTKYNIKENIGLFAEVRDNYLFGDGNDVIISAGLNFYVGKKSKPILDSDGDGVNDNLDKCPNTPKGIKVDASGCPLDSDKDGVYDYLDKCPNTPEGVKVDANGCPLDSDKDGVYDYLDKCPNTPEGVKVDANGCPLDSDKDGVYDGLDKCPNSPAGSKVDKDGCEISISLMVFFDTNRSEVKDQYLAEIEKVATFMKQYPSIKIEIAGHTDNRGDRQKNIHLSQARAESVANILIEKFGISKDRVTAKGYGPDKPIDNNDTEEGRQKNRRVEAVIIK